MHKRILLAAILAAVTVVCPTPAHATVTSTSSSVSYTGNGATTAYTVPFKFLANADLVVTVAGVTKSLGADYTVTGAGAGNGGTVTFATAPANAAAISITRNVGYTQTTSLRSQGAFSPATLETALDRLTMLAQQLNNGVVVNQVLSDVSSASLAPSGGSATRTAAAVAGDLLTGPSLGTAGNGSTDDTSAIQSALSKGRCVYLPPGTYKVTSSLTVPSGGCLIGAGSQSTTINYTGAGDLFTNATPSSRIYAWRFIDLTITTSTGARCFYLSSVSSSYFRSVVCSGFTTGWDIYSPTSGFSVYNRCDDCTAQSGVTGFYLRGTSSNANVFDKSRANVNSSYGFRIADSNENHIIASQIESTTGVGVSIEASGPGLSYSNSITTSRFEGAMTCGIQTAANVSGTQIGQNFFVSNVVGALCDAGTNTQMIGGSSTAGGPDLKMESQLAANTTGVGIPYALRRLSNGGAAALGTNDPMLELNDEATSTGNPTTVSIKTGRATGEYVRGSRTGTRYWNVTAAGSEYMGGGIAWGGIQFTTPTSGSTVNINSDIIALVMKPAAGLATLTVVMPASPDSGQVIAMSTTQTITTLTLNPNSGQSIAANSGIATLAAGAAATYVYRLADTTWYRLH